MAANNEPSSQLPLDNEQVAALLEEIAGLLASQDANPFRVQAYRRAAGTLRDSRRQAAEVLAEEGVSGLTAWPGIGDSLGRTIEHLTQTGHVALLSRLRGDAAPERMLATVPGIGSELARRIHDELDVESLAELEAAALDGRLAGVAGMGRGRIRAVRESLAGRSRPPRQESQSHPPTSSLPSQPSVAELLSVDEEYRRRAAAGRLVQIAPRRFNPTGAAWLPILHTERGERHYTALYSNTARAHELGMIRDWVVIHRDDPLGDGQWTVVTAHYGPLKSKRIVRGRESECQEHYAHRESEQALFS